jgi:hypothetical protein
MPIVFYSDENLEGDQERWEDDNLPDPGVCTIIGMVVRSIHNDTDYQVVTYGGEGCKYSTDTTGPSMDNYQLKPAQSFKTTVP